MEDELRQWDMKERQDNDYMNPAGNGILSEVGYMSDGVEESDGERREEHFHKAWFQTQSKENVWREDHFSAGEATQSEFESLPTKHHVQTPDCVEYLPSSLQNKSARVDSNAKPLKKRDTSHFFTEPASDTTSGVKHLSSPGNTQHSQQERDRELSSWTSVIRDSLQTSNGTDRTLNFKPLDQESFWVKDHGLDHTGLELLERQEVCVTPLLGERMEPNLRDGGGSLNQEEPARSCIKKLDSFIGGSGFHECSSSDSVNFRKTSVITLGPKLESNTASHSPSDSACSPASHTLRQQEVHAVTSDPGLNKAEDECENAKLYVLTENQEAEISLSQLEETHVQCSTKVNRNSRLMLKVASEQKKTPTTQIKSEDGDPCDGQITNVVEIAAGPEKTTPRCDECPGNSTVDAEKRNVSERKQNRSTHSHLNTDHTTFERSPEKGSHFQLSETLGKPDTNQFLTNSEDVECPHTQHSNNSTPFSDQIQHNFREVRRSTSKAQDQAAENMNSQQTEEPLLDSSQDRGSILGTEVANLTREDCKSETSTGILNEPKRNSTEGATVENVSKYEADVLNRLSKLETDQKSPRRRRSPANQNSGTNPVSHTLPSRDSPIDPETKSVGDFPRNQNSFPISKKVAKNVSKPMSSFKHRGMNQKQFTVLPLETNQNDHQNINETSEKRAALPEQEFSKSLDTQTRVSDQPGDDSVRNTKETHDASRRTGTPRVKRKVKMLLKVEPEISYNHETTICVGQANADVSDKSPLTVMPDQMQEPGNDSLETPKSTELFVEVSSPSWTTGPQLDGITLIATTNSPNQEGIISKNNDVLPEHIEDTTLPPAQSSELAFTENDTKPTAVDINIKPPKRGRPSSKKRKTLIEDTSLPSAQNAEQVLSDNCVELITEVDTDAAISRLGRSPLKKQKLHHEDPEDTSKAENNPNVPKRGRPSSKKKMLLIEDTSLPFAENAESVLFEKGVELITEVDPNMAFPRLGRSPLKKRKLHPEDLEDTSLPQGDHPEHSSITDETNPNVPRRGRAPVKKNKNGFLRELRRDSTIPLVQNTELILSENHTELTSDPDTSPTIPRQGRALSTKTKTNVPLEDIGDKTLPHLDSAKPCPESKAEQTTSSPKVPKRGRPKKKLHQEQTGHSTASSIKNFGLSQSNEELTKRDHSKQNKSLGKPLEDSTLPVVQDTEPLLPENNSEITKVDQTIKAPRRGRPKKTKLPPTRKDTVSQAGQSSETSSRENNTGTATSKNLQMFTNPEVASVIPGPVRKQKRPKKKPVLENDEMEKEEMVTHGQKPGQKRPKAGGSRTDVELDQNVKCQSRPDGVTFGHVTALHRRSRTAEKPYKCKICGETFTQLCELTSHQNAHKPDASFPCPCCRQSFTQKADLLWHFKSHLNELGTAENCEHNNTRKTSRSSPDKNIQEETSTIHKQLQEHPTEHTGGGPFCFRSGEEAVQPPAPIRECFGISSSFGEHRCSRCGQSFESRQSLRAHARSHALAWRSARSRGGQSFSSWNRRWWNLLSHRLKRQRYSCDQCSLQFHFFTSYEEHTREHAGQKPYRASPPCPETCTQKPHRPLKCDVCSKSFSSLRNLSKHSVLHNGSTSHACLLCNRSFTGTRVLQEHLDTHQTDASPKPFSFPHKCSQCSACFSSVDVLYAHQIAHSRDLPTKASTSKPTASCPVDPDSTRHWMADLNLDSVPNDKRLYQYSHPDRLYVTTVTRTRDLPNAGDQSSGQEVIAEALNLPQKNTSVGSTGDGKQRRTAFVERSVEIGGESSEDDVDDFQCANCAEKLPSVSSLYEHYIVHALGQQMYRYMV